jgi:type VI secretion system protein ImpL
VHLNSGAGYADLSFDGPWAFLKLLQKSNISHSSGTQFNVSWPMELTDGRTITAHYKVRADRAGSILNQKTLTNFYLPRNLFKG